MDEKTGSKSKVRSEPKNGRSTPEAGSSIKSIDLGEGKQLSEEETALIKYDPSILEIEAEFTETSPAYSSKASRILKLIEDGELTIADALRQPNAPVRTLIQKFYDKYGYDSDEMRKLRQAQIGQSLTIPESRKEALAAVVLSQKEDEIQIRKGEGRLSKSLQELVEKVMDDKRSEKLKKKSSKVVSIDGKDS